MVERSLRTDAPEATAALGRTLGAQAAPGDALLLAGPVGAGKTVLAAGVLQGLGIPGPHPSPTFTILRTYQGRLRAVHVDLYRLGDRFDPDELGWDDLCTAEVVTVVEWPEALGVHTPADALHVKLEPEGDRGGDRRLTLRATGPSSQRLLAAAIASGEVAQ